MFSSKQLSGAGLPEKTLCLTFDDGPDETPGDQDGPDTLRLARYLRRQEVPATFFMVGRRIEQYPHILPEVRRLGHLVGNHTYTHPDMVDFLEEGGDCIGEIVKTDRLLGSGIVFFRAPYGRWTARVSSELNRNPRADRYVGPFHWDIEGRDWAYWRDGGSAEACADHYLREIVRVGRGIVLMHDSSADIETIRVNNRTPEMVRLLVPRLKNMGYTFIRLDEIKYAIW